MELFEIRDGLRERIKQLKTELAGAEKALENLLPKSERAPKAKKAKASDTERPPDAPVDVDAVLRLCAEEPHNAEKLALKLGVDSQKAGAVLSRLYAKQKLARTGDRGSYEYSAKLPSGDNGFPSRGAQA